MFARRDLPDDVAAVRDRHAPGAVVLDSETDFETLETARAEQVGLVVESLSPKTYPESWLPPDAPEALLEYVRGEFTVGAPGDGGVTWTRQTDPPVVVVKPRVRDSPADFVAFLVAEALVQVGLGTDAGTVDPAPDALVPEHFLGFFEDRYVDLAAISNLSPAGTYQVAAALYDGWLGLYAREAFAGWRGERDRLFDAWQDAGERLEPRIEGLPAEVARGESDFATATELACAALKHGLEVPAPYAALVTAAYRRHGADYAVRWAEKTLDALAEE
ncbi:MAG: hypothetical protein V5A23_01425 [Halobacteriales archaeon]